MINVLETSRKYDLYNRNVKCTKFDVLKLLTTNLAISGRTEKPSRRGAPLLTTMKKQVPVEKHLSYSPCNQVQLYLRVKLSSDTFNPIFPL